jgi:hypothetical protein
MVFNPLRRIVFIGSWPGDERETPRVYKSRPRSKEAGQLFSECGRAAKKPASDNAVYRELARHVRKSLGPPKKKCRIVS